VLDHLDLYGCHLVDDSDSSVYRGIVPVKPPVSGCHHRPLLLQDLHESAQVIKEVVGIHFCPPGHKVDVNQPLLAKEG
jgi:hypothetical protein